MNPLSLLILTWLYLVHQNCAQNPSNEENNFVVNLNINIDPSQKGINNSTKGKRWTWLSSFILVDKLKLLDIIHQFYYLDWYILIKGLVQANPPRSRKLPVIPETPDKPG